MKKIIGAVVLLVFGVMGYFVWLEMQKSVTTDDAEIDGRIVAISPRVGGHIVEMNVQDEQFVKAGDVLVKLDPQDFEVAVAKARADLDDALAGLQSSRTDVPLTTATTSSTLSGAQSVRQDATAGVAWAEKQMSVWHARLASAEANVRVAEANANKASQDVERYKMLVAKDEISKQQYDQAVSAVEAARATVEAQKATVVEAQQNIAAAEVAVLQAKSKVSQADATVESAMTGPQQVAITQSKVKAGQAKVEQRQAELAQAQLNLKYTTIVAPVSGVVGKKSVELGQNVAPGQQMMAIVPLDDIWITANFKETQLRDMRPGQPVKISVDADGRDYSGKVARIAGASGARFSLLPPENATGNYVKVVQRIPVRIELDPGQNQDHLLRPGMSVTPSVRIK
jgi:membrane fusion protein (multidrug efflux system)